MLRNDHRIMIQQWVNGAEHWTTLRLIDVSEGRADGFRFVHGTWNHTNASYNDELIKFTSYHPQYLKYTYTGDASRGVLRMVATLGSASHRADETESTTGYIDLFQVRRTAMGEFSVGSILGAGDGVLHHNANPHFNAGEIQWQVGTYY